MKKSFMTRALAMGLSLAMAFSLSAATNVSVASAAAKPAMASKQFAVRVGGATKSYKASAATRKAYVISKATVGNPSKATVKVNTSKKSLKVTPGTVTGSTVVTITFKNIKTKKSTAVKYRCVVKEDNTKLTVTNVAAVDALTLTVTGTKLGDLTAADIKVTPTIAVASYTAAADGKTATVKLAAGLQSGTEYTVAVNGSEFKVKYTVGEITSVAVVETSYDNDTPGQKLAITVNGGAPITVTDLVADGYFVEFSVTTAGTANANFFKNGYDTNKSQTGLLKDSLTEADYQVQVVLTKGSSIIASPIATVKIVNLDAAATSFDGFVLAGKTTGINTGDPGYSIKGVKLSGKTLVSNERVVLTEAAILTADGKVKLPASVLPKVGVTSDNINVIQVSKNTDGDQELLAVAPGTATITFTYGSVKTTATYTVVSDGRYPNTATAETTTLRAIVGGDKVSTNVIVKDQYGELVQGLVFGTSARLYSVDETIATVTSTGTTGTNGKAAVDVQGIAQGNTSLAFSYYDGNHNKTPYTSANIVVTSINEANRSKNKLVAKWVADQSSDLTLDVYDKTKDDKVTVQLNTYTINDALVSEGAFIVSGSYFEYNKAIIGLSAESGWTEGAAPTNGFNRAVNSTTKQAITFEAKVKGTTVLSLHTPDGTQIASTTITVTDSKPYLTGVTFNANCPTTLTHGGSTLSYTDVFNIGNRDSNPVITGITVAQPYAQLRIDAANATATSANIYIDAASDGIYQAAEDTIIGTITLSGWTPSSKLTDTYTLPTTGGSRKTITYTVTDKFTNKVVAAKAIVVEK